MAQRTVLEHPDPRLGERSEPVTAFGSSLARLVEDLVDTLHASESAIGLSAPQIGERQQVAVLDLSPDRSEPQVYVNPTILARSHFGFVEESCLSVPGANVNVWRATRIRVRARAPSGETFERDLDGLFAVCLQHEMDHLEGRLLVDRMWFFRRLRYNRTLTKELRTSPAA